MNQDQDAPNRGRRCRLNGSCSRWSSPWRRPHPSSATTGHSSVAFVAVLEQPVFLVLVASALAAFVAPVIFFLNFYYCLVIIPKQDRAFYPSMFARWFGWLSLVVFTGMTLVLIYWRIWVRYFVE